MKTGDRVLKFVVALVMTGLYQITSGRRSSQLEPVHTHGERELVHAQCAGATQLEHAQCACPVAWRTPRGLVLAPGEREPVR